MVTRVACWLGVALALLLLPSTSLGAKHAKAPAKPKTVHTQPQKQPAQPHPEQVTLEGTVVAAAAGRLQMTADKNAHKDWTVTGTLATKVHVMGTAKPEFLRSGLVVQFKAEFDTHGVAKDKLNALSIVTASPENPQGVTADGGQSKVVGRVSSCHAGKLTVHAGSRTVQVELADDPKIDVAVADAALIMPGSKITVHGTFIKGKPGLCEAADVKVTLAEPLTGKKKPLKGSALKASDKPILTDEKDAKESKDGTDSAAPDKP